MLYHLSFIKACFLQITLRQNLSDVIITDFLTRCWTSGVQSSECLTSKRDCESCKCISYFSIKYSTWAELFFLLEPIGFSATGPSSSGVHSCTPSKRAHRKYSQVKYIRLSHSIRYSEKISRPFPYFILLQWAI